MTVLGHVPLTLAPCPFLLRALPLKKGGCGDGEEADRAQETDHRRQPRRRAPLHLLLLHHEDSRRI